MLKTAVPVSILTREFLYEEYIAKNKSAKQIAAETGRAGNTIRQRLANFGIRKQIAGRKHYRTKHWDTLTKEFLEEEYLKKEKTIKSIAKMIHAGEKIIHQALERHGIAKRPLKRRRGRRKYHWISKDLLHEKYTVEKKSTYAIADELRVEVDVIQRRLRKFGIPRRTKSDYAEDLAGKTFGYLLVLPQTKLVKNSRDSRTHYLCQCTKCGRHKWVNRCLLVGGQNQSCGCLEEENRKSFGQKCWTGYKDLSGTYFGSIRRRAKHQGYAFDITVDYVWDLFVRQDGQCVYTGYCLTMPMLGQNGFAPGFDTEVKYASLDRIDSSKGYIMGNVQWVWVKVNKVKFDLTEEEFIEICYKVVERHGSNARRH